MSRSRRRPGCAPLAAGLLLSAGVLYAGAAAGKRPPAAEAGARPRASVRIELTDKAAKLGLTRKDILAQIYSYIVRTKGADRLGELMLSTPGGKLVRLSEVAAVEVVQDDSPLPSPAPRKDGRVKSKVLTKAFAALWPKIAAARKGAGEGASPAALTENALRRLTDMLETFWVEPAVERRFERGVFDDEHNAAKLEAAVREFARRKAGAPAALAFLADQCRTGRLRGAQLAVASRMAADFLRQERRRAALLARKPQGSKLAFRIAPQREGAAGMAKDAPTLSEAEIKRYKKELAEKGPAAAAKRGCAYAWFEARDKASGLDDLIAGKHGGRTYVLLCNAADHVMLPGGKSARGWGLTETYETTDDRGRPAVGFTFDEAGAARFSHFTAAHKGMRLAVLVDDRALSAPRIMGVIGGRGVITGNFTRREVRDLIWALERGMQSSRKKDSREKDDSREDSEVD